MSHIDPSSEDAYRGEKALEREWEHEFDRLTASPKPLADMFLSGDMTSEGYTTLAEIVIAATRTKDAELRNIAENFVFKLAEPW